MYILFSNTYFSIHGSTLFLQQLLYHYVASPGVLAFLMCLLSMPMKQPMVSPIFSPMMNTTQLMTQLPREHQINFLENILLLHEKSLRTGCINISSREKVRPWP